MKGGVLPNVAGAKKKFLAAMEDAGFSVLNENTVDKGDVMFTQWLCAVERK